jgi:excisionase family DNA binding protein
MHEPIALTIKQSVEAAGVRKTYLYEAIKRRELPARKAGRRTLILHTDLQAWLRALPSAR